MVRTYSRTSVARTLMARLPWLFRTRTLVHRNKSHRCRFRIIFFFLFFILRNGMLCVLIRIVNKAILMRTHNIPSCEENRKESLLCLLTWLYNKPSMTRTTHVSNKFSEPQRYSSHLSSTVVFSFFRFHLFLPVTVYTSFGSNFYFHFCLPSHWGSTLKERNLLP